LAAAPSVGDTGPIVRRCCTKQSNLAEQRSASLYDTGGGPGARLLPTHILALAFGSLSIGLSIAWSLIGAAGYVLILRGQRGNRPAPLIERSAWTKRLGIAALSMMPIVLPTILLNFHDEAYFNEHFAMIAHLQNGTYPPRYLYEPSLPLRYHYGFDIAGAIVTGLLRVRLDHAVDLLTLALWSFRSFADSVSPSAPCSGVNGIESSHRYL
jgi:hypothetical protein